MLRSTSGKGERPVGGEYRRNCFVADVRVDPERFDDFVNVQYKGLLRFLRRRTASSQDAEDVAQESVVKLLRYRDSAPAADWKPLLYRIAVNAANDKCRNTRHHRTIVQRAAEHPDAPSSRSDPDEFADHQQKLESLRGAILRLPPKCRRVCLLRLVRSMTNAEIAEHCGTSVKTVEKHLAKAVAALRQGVGNPAA